MEPDVRRVFDSLRWLVRELRLAQNGAEHGLSAAQLFVLHVLKEQGALSVGELAERTATDPSSVSVVVRKLHEKALVAKQPSAEDRRRLVITLTAAGTRSASQRPVPVQQLLMGRLAQLKPRELHTLAGLLERVAPQDTGGLPAPMFFHESSKRRGRP